MTTKRNKDHANAMETDNFETDDDIINQDETDQMMQKETELDLTTKLNLTRELRPKSARPESKRKIVKQTDIDEKDQSNESFDKMKLIKENLMLLSEIDKLKKSNRTMSQRIYYLETVVKVPLKKS